MGDKALRGNKLTVKDIKKFYEETKKKKRITQPPIKAGKGPIPGGGFSPIGKPIAFRRTEKNLGGILKGAKEIAKKVFTKKKPKKVKFKSDTSKVPTSKNISSLISKERDPFVRNKLQSIKESAARGDVIGRDGNVIATPTKERTAKTIMERHPGSYQRKKPE